MPDNYVLSGILARGWADLPFEPFKPGITIHWLEQGEPAIALLKYEPGARAPLHFHPATESVLILEGAQSDAHGTYHAGDFVLNFKGTQHEVWSENGCVALLQWAKPVQFL
ncbi:cupin domain-containing protein [Thalassovita sp.]|jgi:anti-sigma factor ChrR (cupin superfamily)|uniref:cupin domain-containing protein n=1 Tax=Thalassovita sp. TaxID=1979401 RepID=UPI003B5BED09